MKHFFFNSFTRLALLAVIFLGWNGYTAIAQTCPTNSLIINTGYDPTTGTAITPEIQIPTGCYCGTAVPDPHWFATYISDGMVAAASLMSQTVVAAGGHADVLSNDLPTFGSPSPWTTYSLSQWINCINSNSPYTLGSATPTAYTTILTRTFTSYATDDITINMNISCDNYITSIDIDGDTLLSQAPPAIDPGDGPGGYGMFVLHTWTVTGLSAGTHNINVVLNDLQSEVPFVNPMGLNVYGTVTSVGNSLESESGGTTITTAGSLSFTQGTSIVLSNATSGGTWSSSSTGIASVDGSGNVYGLSPGTAAINYTYSCAPVVVTVNPIVADPPPPGSCPTNSLIINTGYDPTTGTAITPEIQIPTGCYCGTAVPDPHWFATYISDGIIAAAPLLSQTVVAAGGHADVLTNDLPTFGSPSPWTTYSLSQWISCLNSNSPYTVASATPTAYTTILSRTFTSYATDDITINMNISCDNYITSVDIDGDTLLSQAPPAIDPGDGPGGYGSFVSHTWTVPSLPAGTHNINVVLNDLQSEVAFVNPMGLNVYGTVTSVGNSLESESGGTPITSAFSLSFTQGNSIVLSNATPGGTWSSSSTGIASVDGSGNVYGLSPGTATINYSNSCASVVVTVNPLTLTPPGPLCLINSLVINTGYDPVVGSTITPEVETAGGCYCGTPVTDPHWFVTNATLGIVTEAGAMFQTVPAFGSNADVIPTFGSPWTTNPTSQWISCLNSNTPYTLGSGTPTAYNTTLTRSFSMGATDNVIITMNTSSDNYITSIDIDGDTLPLTSPSRD